MKNNIFIGTIAILFLFASCKTVQYQEFGSFGGGSMTAKQSVTNRKKIEANNETEESKSTSIETSLLPCESNLTQINKVVKFSHSEKTKKQALAKKHTKINIKQALKLIPKIKSTPTKQLLQEIKNQKQIFNYEGENGLMTFGFNVLAYGLMALVFGMILVEFGIKIGNIFLYFGINGSIIGGIIWLGSWLYELSFDYGGLMLGIFLGMVGLTLLIASAFAI